MLKILREVVNKELGITALITEGYYGYHLVLKDDDSGEFLPTVTVYQDINKALLNAIKLVNGEPID